MKTKKCPVCDQKIVGRKDKIYCSLSCKSAHRYEIIQEKEKLFFKVDRQLKINRRILKKHNTTGKTILRRSELHNQGFDPSFFTHFRKTPTGDVYFYCYDFGFMKIEEKTNAELKKKYLIVNWNGI